MSVTIDVCPHRRTVVNIQRKCMKCEEEQPTFRLRWTTKQSSIFTVCEDYNMTHTSSSSFLSSQDLCCECDMPLDSDCVDIPLACSCEIGRYPRAHIRCLTSVQKCPVCIHQHTFSLQWGGPAVLLYSV
jgi:hypothetical protein